MYYNTMVALPMSLSLVKDRLEQGYYRQVQGVMGDVATIQGNAQAFNGEDSQVAEMAAGCPPVMLHSCTLSLRKVNMTASYLVHDWASKRIVCFNISGVLSVTSWLEVEPVPCLSENSEFVSQVCIAAQF